MVEPGATEQAVKKPVIFSIDEHHLGHEIRNPNDSFALANMFSQDAKLLGGDRFTKVYFRTESENIYMLNSKGRLLNGNESKRSGKIVSEDLDVKELEKQKLTIGVPFEYEGGGHTTRITEIVPVTDRKYDSDSLYRITEGRHHSIREELIKMLPQEKAVEQQSPSSQEAVVRNPESNPRRVKTFKTAQGSIYTYDQDGKTTRFKTATGEQQKRQDITVFANLTPDEEQEVLHAYQHVDDKYKNSKVYIVERQKGNVPKFLFDIKDIKDPNEICLVVILDKNTGAYSLVKKASVTPTVGSNAFDMRQWNEDGQTLRERHLGNKVVDIQYENK